MQYSQNWLTMADLEPRTVFNPWTEDTASDPPPSSLPAQVAHKVVEANWPEFARKVHWGLLEAYFSQNRDISDWNVLADVVAEVGVDRDSFAEAVNTQRQAMAELVIDEHNLAIEQGITAVPTVLINEVLPVPGAQESDSYIIWIERILERQATA